MKQSNGIFLNHKKIGHLIMSKKKVTGGWTKYGGGRAVVTEIRGEWTCQSCGEAEPMGVPSYFYEFIAGEFMRICSACVSEDCMDYKGRRDYDPLQTYLDSFKHI